MSRNQIQSNLVGEKVRITMGLETEEQIENGKKLQSNNSHHACWRHLGERGHVRAVYMAEGECECVVEVGGGKMVKVFAVHLSIEAESE